MGSGIWCALGITAALMRRQATGKGGRITIPQDIREDVGIEEGDNLTLRVEENPRGIRQMVIWRAEEDEDEG